jgi:primosomal protein N''
VRGSGRNEGVGASFAIAVLACLAAAEPDTRVPGAEYHLVDMVVAQVDATVITRSRLVAETRLVLLRTGGPEMARAAFLSEGLLKTVLKVIVQRELLLGEMRRLKLHDAPDPDIEKRIAEIKNKFATTADYERFLDKSGFRDPGAQMIKTFEAPPALVAIIVAELQVDQLLNFRVKKPTIRDSDIALCYEANRKYFEGRPLPDVRELIKRRLEDQDQERAFAALIDQLQRRATIRYAKDFEPLPDVPSTEESVGIVCPERRSESAAAEQR